MTESKICTCPSGDGSLVHPCPAHPAVEQAGGDERAAFEAWATHLPMDRQPLRPDLYMPQTQWAWEAWQFRAALAQPSPAPELAERGTQHRFSTTEQTCRHDFAGVWWNDNGETKTGKECRECGFFIADIAEAPELERPEVVGYLATAEHPKHGQPHKAFNYFKDQHDAQVAHWRERGCEVSEDELMTVTQHARIVGALRADRDSWAEQAEQRLADWDEMRKERDAALARVAELEHVLQVVVNAADHGSWPTTVMYGIEKVREVLAGSGAPSQAQHSVPGIAESVSECMALAQTVFARMEGLMPRGKKLPEKHVARRLLAELETLAKLAAAPGKEGV
ncbi:hypothetical protein [Pseudomonas aeruginosa]|uniref:hypothetical protein n=1 Tax=Pseudomonas aeruginosa TaxID=287 RepID=UPI00197C8B10|nr:hypothetical protein [Pseudomonas aeruginosa]